METDNRPLFSLTVEEYIKINKSLLRDANRVEFPLSQQTIEMPELIFIDEAARITKYTEKTIYTKVCRREIPVVSSGRPLTFSRKQLNEWMANGRPSIAAMITKDFINRKNIK
jgi:excisionase family DNA binding protein